jgi:hypothetical protein
MASLNGFFFNVERIKYFKLQDSSQQNRWMPRGKQCFKAKQTFIIQSTNKSLNSAMHKTGGCKDGQDDFLALSEPYRAPTTTSREKSLPMSHPRILAFRLCQDRTNVESETHIFTRPHSLVFSEPVWPQFPAQDFFLLPLI